MTNGAIVDITVRQSLEKSNTKKKTLNGKLGSKLVYALNR